MGSARTYAIGDIHGQFDKLREVHKWIDADARGPGGDVHVVHIGDLVDRGPDSAAVVDWLVSGCAAGKPWLVLKGNHDHMMSLFLETPSRRDGQLLPELGWLHERVGGRTTLTSYGVAVGDDLDPAEIHAAAVSAVPERHQAFLRGLETMFRSDTVVFVHAGIRPGVPLRAQTDEDLMWIRGEFHSDLRDHGALIVHGHTPVVEVTHFGNRINIDTGAGFGRALSVIVIEDGAIWQLGPAGRQLINLPAG